MKPIEKDNNLIERIFAKEKEKESSGYEMRTASPDMTA
jgi:hypothetical protein